MTEAIRTAALAAAATVHDGRAWMPDAAVTAERSVLAMADRFAHWIETGEHADAR